MAAGSAGPLAARPLGNCEPTGEARCQLHLHQGKLQHDYGRRPADLSLLCVVNSVRARTHTRAHDAGLVGCTRAGTNRRTEAGHNAAAGASHQDTLGKQGTHCACDCGTVRRLYLNDQSHHSSEKPQRTFVKKELRPLRGPARIRTSEHTKLSSILKEKV